MRPLELVIAGFRSFADRTVIDWRGRRLVGIVGPIGSGKSSILDAIAFALYGKTPVFSTESKTLIRHGAEHARVELLFEADGETWRVIRVIRQSGAGRHVLYRETGEPLTNAEREKAGEVTARIEELLGLDFETFCRSVLLAQNRFAEFLNASPGDRDKVLKGVFGFDRLDDMQALARTRKTHAELELRELEGRLASIADDERRLATAREALAASTRRAERLEETAPEVRGLAEREAEARRRAEDARRRRRELEELARQIPAPDEVEELAAAADQAADELARQEQDARRARDAVADAERERRKGLVQAHEARHRELGALESAHEQARRTLEASEVEIETAAAALREAREQRAALEAELGGPDALERAREKIRELALARAAAERERDHRQRTDESLRKAEEGLERAREERDRAAEKEEVAATARELATATVTRAEEDLHRAEHAEMALTLAQELEAGQPCPVCGRKVGAVQARLPSSESQAHARRTLEAARAAAREAGDELRKAAKAAAAAQQALTHAESAVETARREREEAVRRVEERDEAVRAVAVAVADLLGDGEPESLLRAAEERLRKSDERIEALVADERRAGDELREARHAMELSGQRRAATTRALEDLESQLTALGVDVREAGLEPSPEDADPDELLDRARSRLADVEEKLAAARKAERAANERVEAARRRLEATRRDQQRLAGRLAGLAGQLGHTPEAAGDALPPRRLARLVRERFDAARDDADRAVDDARGAEAAARDERHAIHERLELDAEADFDAVLAEARAARATAAATVEDLEQRLERSRELQSERRRVEAERDLYARLADDLTASKFLRYLLEQERAALADLGSERFELLSESRYRFTADGTFQVIDQYNANAVRKPETLSGGETFLASLALALALAEKVTAGGGRLDAFFLDEGFGSLDPEHLTLAMEGIERLVTESPNRLVTVVSHVPEMRERIEDLIELDKDPLTGSTIVRQGQSARE